ncbi:MAG: histidine kinase, partial [Ruminococcus sp.]|nr:histidine kinase [Ruminococcus sp.]
SEPVYVQNQVSGYVLCMIEQSRMLQLIGPYRELDYMGVLLLSGEELLCASPELVGEDMQSIRSSAEIIKEKQIGLSGFNLVVYSKRRISEDLSGYFRIAMPVTIAILLVVVVIFFMYMRRQTIAEMAQRAALDRETTRGILLQKQINAHFTVNTLNSLRALINKGDIEAATRICDELSTLLRYANEGDEYISLMDEFYMLEQYIEIMQMRYPEHIDALVEFDDIYEELMIPRMLLQPIVENAIVHGLQKKDGTLRISASLVRQ